MISKDDSAMKVTFTKDEQEKLQHLSDLLHLFYHRNKNQHRRSVWWRHFSIFRKQVNALLVDVVSFNEVSTTHVARTKKKAREPQLRLQVEQRLRFWQDILVSRCQHAFSQVTADGRFAVLGLVLSAALAETCQITGITAVLEDLGQAEVESVLNAFASEAWEGQEPLVDDKKQRGEDFGEVIQREPLPLRDDAPVSRKRDRSPDTRSPPVAADTKSTPTVPKTVKRKRRKGNAIDDLFGGLG